eukprot:COSAG02_NODE_28610_length_586_cov_1.002053_2_plen_87_part_00
MFRNRHICLETVTKRGVLGGIKRHCSIFWYESSHTHALIWAVLRFGWLEAEAHLVGVGSAAGCERQLKEAKKELDELRKKVANHCL